MIPYSYNMVDMGGIDLAEANGTVVPGVYERITEAMNLCGDVILYNWKFAGIDIVPSAYAILQQASSILINGMIQVTELDVVTVLAIDPPIGTIEPLEVTENGVYEAEPPVSGYNPVTVALQFTELLAAENGEYTPQIPSRGFSKVTVNVPQPAPTIQSLSVTENGTYTAPTGVDGYSPIAVNVPQSTPTIQSLSVTENGTYTAPTGVDGYSPVTVNVPSRIPVITPLEVTSDGIYNPPSGVDGYAPVTVNVSGDDPFALKNYIESSGTQWIDTGYIPKQNSSYEFVTAFLSGNPTFSMIIGARDAREGTGGNPVIFGPGNSSFQIGWGTQTLTTGISSTPFVGLKGVYNFDKDGYDARTESKRPSGYGAFSGGEPLTTNSLYLFSLNAAGSEYGAITRCMAKLYRFRIFESGVLVHEFIPWQENGVVCLKDTVTSEIKYNSGTGNFVYGTDQ